MNLTCEVTWYFILPYKQGSVDESVTKFPSHHFQLPVYKPSHLIQ